MLNEIDLSRVDLNLLVLFEAVLEEGHVGRAARKLHLSPSAVSHGIGRLRRTFNDPLFLKHPKGVVPTSRATALSVPISQVLAQVRQVVASADPFDPRRSERRFVIGAPDAIAAVVVQPLLNEIRRTAPRIGMSVLDVQPMDALAALDAHQIDIALYPLEDLPARFEARELYEERFVIAARSDHALIRKPSLQSYCAAQHLLVSRRGDSHGFVDDLLEQRGVSRKVLLTVPSFMWALAVIGAGDLIGTLPGGLVRAHGKRFGVAAAEPPFSIDPSRIRAVAPKAAMADAGVAWMMEVLQALARSLPAERRRSRS